jgi:hypothetical protein
LPDNTKAVVNLGVVPFESAVFSAQGKGLNLAVFPAELAIENFFIYVESNAGWRKRSRNCGMRPSGS